LSGVAGRIQTLTGGNALLGFNNNTPAGSVTFGENFTLPGPFTNAGTIDILKGVMVTVNGSYTETGGKTIVDGTLAVTPGFPVNISGGAFACNGTISGGEVSNSSVFIIGDSTKRPGLCSPDHGYTQLATGALDVQIAGAQPGTQYSQFNVTGAVKLGGTLNIALIGQFKPAVGQTFTILSSPSGITGTFSTVNGTAIDSSKHFSVSYNPKDIVVNVVSGP
jgi:hypothetical protein